MDKEEDSSLLEQFDSIKNENEEFYWIEKPAFIPFLLGGMIAYIGFWAFIVVFFVVISSIQKESDAGGIYSLIWFIALIASFQLVSRLLNYPNTWYALTRERVIIRNGIFGANFKTINLANIMDMVVSVDPIERLFKAGTVQFYSGETKTSDGDTTKIYDDWNAISLPYDVFKMVEQARAAIHSKQNRGLKEEPHSNYMPR